MSKAREWLKAEWSHTDPLAKGIATGGAMLIGGLILAALVLGFLLQT